MLRVQDYLENTDEPATPLLALAQATDEPEAWLTMDLRSGDFCIWGKGQYEDPPFARELAAGHARSFPVCPWLTPDGVETLTRQAEPIAAKLCWRKPGAMEDLEALCAKFRHIVPESCCFVREVPAEEAFRGMGWKEIWPSEQTSEDAVRAHISRLAGLRCRADFDLELWLLDCVRQRIQDGLSVTPEQRKRLEAYEAGQPQ